MSARARRWIVELINVTLFVSLYIIIVTSVMLALGVRDPVRYATEKHWAKTRPELELQGYCEKHKGNYCDKFYAGTSLSATTDNCDLTDKSVPSVMDARLNCTILSETVWAARATNPLDAERGQ